MHVILTVVVFESLGELNLFLNNTLKLCRSWLNLKCLFLTSQSWWYNCHECLILFYFLQKQQALQYNILSTKNCAPRKSSIFSRFMLSLVWCGPVLDLKLLYSIWVFYGLSHLYLKRTAFMATFSFFHTSSHNNSIRHK